MKTAIAAVFALAAGASGAYTNPSFITCKDSAVVCTYGYDPKVTRCKPWDGSDFACTKICCAPPPPPPPPPPSFVRCDSKPANTACQYGYKSDPKVGGVMRCKLWEGSTEQCSTKYCCLPPPPPPPPPPPAPKPDPKPKEPSLISCMDAKAKVTCKHGYKTDPKTKGTMRCKLWSGSTVHCSEKTCCLPPPPPPPAPEPSSLVRCDTIAVICPYGFKTDPKVGGVMRCKKTPGSTVECNAITCCAPQHY